MSVLNKLKLGALACCFLIVSTACNEDEFLMRVPVDRFTPASFPRNEQQIVEATTAIYPIMRNMAAQALNDYGDYRSDNTTFQFNANDRGREANERVDYFLLLTSDGFHNGFYNPPYVGIARANEIIDRIRDIEFTDEDRRTTALAEARFFRGWFHFLLVQHFGDIVPRTTVIEGDGTELASLRRQPEAGIYTDVIIPDLEFAIENLPEEWDMANVGRVTSGVANMALAKSYFHQRNFAAALPLLNAIIESDQYSLMDNYQDVFFTEQELNSEIIWSAQYNAAVNQGAGFMTDWVPQIPAVTDDNPLGPGQQKGGTAFNVPTCDLLDAYEDGDLRFDATIDFYDQDEDDPENEIIPYSVKFLTFPFPESGGTDVDYPIFRYADVLLMQAEALLETQGGLPNTSFSNINILRARAGLGAYFPGNPDPALNILTPEDLRDAIRRERRVELAYEGSRSYDLRRYGIYEETMRAHGEVQKMKQPFLADIPEAYTNIRALLAIPQGQVDLYGYRQNPGWE